MLSFVNIAMSGVKANGESHVLCAIGTSDGLEARQLNYDISRRLEIGDDHGSAKGRRAQYNSWKLRDGVAFG